MNRLTVGLLLGLLAGVPAGAAIHAQFAEKSALVKSSAPALVKSIGVAEEWDSSTLKKAMDPMPSPRAAASEADGWLMIFAWITGACLILSLVVPSVCAWIEEIRKRPKV